MRIELTVFDPETSCYLLRCPLLSDIAYAEYYTEEETKIYMRYALTEPWIVNGAYDDVCDLIEALEEEDVDAHKHPFSNN